MVVPAPTPRRQFKPGYRPDGFELWRGPSSIDGQPIGVVITHVRRPPLQEKIGDMAQAWILPILHEPNDAVRTGADESVCGSCRFRPSLDGGCYVTVFSTAQRVWWAWQQWGSYQPEKPPTFTKDLRIGAWGDPTAVPLAVWLRLLPSLPGWTAYTSRWDELLPESIPHWQRFAMASVKNEDEQRRAEAAGWRTYRPRSPDDPILPGEITCPAAPEAPTHGKAKCAGCGLCNGVRLDPRTRRVLSPQPRNLTIIVHGPASGRARRTVEKR